MDFTPSKLNLGTQIGGFEVEDITPTASNAGQQDEESTELDLNDFLRKNVRRGDFVLIDPLVGVRRHRLKEFGRQFGRAYGFSEELFAKAAILAQDTEAWGSGKPGCSDFREEDIRKLQFEQDHEWKHSRKFWSVVFIHAAAAISQGWSQTAANTANVFYKPALGLDDSLFALVNAAPMLACGFGCILLNWPLNHFWGRRGTIFATCLLCAAASLGQFFPRSWGELFVARLFLGLGIGIKSATSPVYMAECAPKPIRGRLVMLWQLFTAVGIFFGTVIGIAFYTIGNAHKISRCNASSQQDLLSLRCSLRWRLMLSVPLIIPTFICLIVFRLPESPRWLVKRERYPEAFASLRALRMTELQAARDLFFIHCHCFCERELRSERHRVSDMFKLIRNRRAVVASFVVMIMQQLCGINVVVTYSTEIFRSIITNDDERIPLIGSVIFGLLNLLGGVWAWFIIDKRGRRFLLLATFPFMFIFMLMAGLASLVHISADRVTDSRTELRSSLVMLGIYLFTIAYSLGEGPVPFTYSAECYPLNIRDLGMSFATTVNWWFHFGVVMAFPTMKAQNHMKIVGTFVFYACMNIIGFFLVLLFVPETRNMELENLNKIFSIPIKKYARYGLAQGKYFVEKNYKSGLEAPMIPTGQDEEICREEGSSYSISLNSIQTPAITSRSSLSRSTYSSHNGITTL